MFDASYTVDVISKFSQGPTDRSSTTDKLQCTVCIFKKVPRKSLNFGIKQPNFHRKKHY